MHEQRIYPAKFASKLVKLNPKMKRSPPKIHVEVTQKTTISQHTTICGFHLYLLCAHHNPVPSQLPLDMVTPLAELFAAAPAGDCPEAALGDTLHSTI